MGGNYGKGLLIGVLVFVLGLPLAVVGATDPALRLGIDKYREGDRQEALSLLRGFVIRNYEDPELPTAYLYLARIFQDNGSHRDALLYTGRIPADRKGSEALLVEGVSQLAIGQPEMALATLLRCDPGPLPAADQARRVAALAETHAALGNYLEALSVFPRNAADQDEKLLAQAHAMLREHLSPAELAEAAFMFQGTAIGEDARTQQALQAYQRGDTAEAQRLLSPVVQSATAFPYRREATDLWQKLTGAPPATVPQANVPAENTPPGDRALGVMLPQAGRHAAFGRLVQRGMEFAAELYAQQHPAIPLVIRDSGAGPEDSSRMVAELAGDARILAIAGPLTGGAAKVAAEQAQQQHLPLFTLSPRDGLPEIGDYVFRNSLTSPAQVQTLVRHAMERQGLTDFAVLYPENTLGNEMANLFIREVQQRGGRIVSTQGYGETTTDFRTALKLLKGEDPGVPDQAEASTSEVAATGTVPRPALPFQALFIPAYADQIRLIAPQLTYYGIEGIQLLGINGWNTPDLLRDAGPFVQGAIFVDGFFPASADPAVRRFVDGYTAKYGAAPTILEAQGFDVANILLTLLGRPEIRSRDDVRQALAQLANYPGASGALTIGPTGDALKKLYVLRVAGDAIVPVE